MASIFFDASTVAPQSSSNPLPAGTYLAHVMESSIAPLKTGNGQALKLTLEILDGQFKGKRVWEHLNIQHTNEEAQRIAQSQLSALCHAINVIKLTDTSDLHFKPVKIKVAVREAQGQYGASNNIKGYEQAGGVAQTAAPTNFAPAAAPAASNAPAWAKK